MFSPCILATDLSGASDQMAANLSGLLPLGVSAVILAHCMEVSPPLATAANDLHDALHTNLRTRAEKRLQTLRERLEAQGFRTTIRILYGSPAPALAQCARESGANLLIVASRGASVAKNIALGSSALDILRLSPIPVLLKRIEIKELSGQRHHRLVCRDFASHILYATDFSATAERAFDYLEQILSATHAAVTLLHVSRKNDAQTAKESLAQLQNLQARLENTGARRIEISLVLGKTAGESIVQAARRQEVSLLIMGTQGRGFIEGLLLGSESHTALRRTVIPILMVPPLAPLKRDTETSTTLNRSSATET